MGENIAANVPPTIGICAALCEYNSIIITLTIGIVILPYEHTYMVSILFFFCIVQYFFFSYHNIESSCS